MISVNRTPIIPNTFPDHTAAFRFAITPPHRYRFDIDWRYEGDHECMLLWHLVHHIRQRAQTEPEINLYLPYVPNARMDRTKNPDEVFTLKYFAEFLNSLRFSNVRVLDPHSPVTAALIDRVRFDNVGNFINKTISILEARGLNPVLCFPDEGAAKRYAPLSDRPYTFAIKHRDWRSGNITGLSLTNPDLVSGHDVLIVDDICSRGGTFTHTARALREAGARNIFLYVTHCEKTIFDGTVLTDGLITEVFTTNSIFTGSHEKITTFRL